MMLKPRDPGPHICSRCYRGSAVVVDPKVFGLPARGLICGGCKDELIGLRDGIDKALAKESMRTERK